MMEEIPKEVVEEKMNEKGARVDGIKRTEQFAIEEGERERIWQLKYGEKLPKVVEEMNRLLKEGTKGSRWKLHNMLLDKSFFSHYKQTDVVAGMYVVMQIYEREVESGVTPNILEKGNTVEELLKYLEKLKFILYRVDFDIDKESEQELVSFLKQHNTSGVTIETMVTTVVMRPFQMALKMARIFEQNLMYKEMFTIQNFINQRWPGNYRMLQKQAELYKKTGHNEYSKECLMQIPDYPEEICGEQQQIFKMQEKLWRLRYKEKTVCKEIVQEIKEQRITEEAWKYYLQNEPVMEAEYYLTLADILLEANMEQLAWVTLCHGEQVTDGDEGILCIMADVCVKRGDVQQAVQCLERVRKPGKMTDSFLMVCQKVLGQFVGNEEEICKNSSVTVLDRNEE